LVSKTGIRKSALFITNVGWRIGEFGARITHWAVDDAELSARIATMGSRFAVQRRKLAYLISRAVLCVALLFSIDTVGADLHVRPASVSHGSAGADTHVRPYVDWQTAQAPRKKNAPLPGAEPPPVSLEEAATLEAVITTDLGVIRFEFFPAKAPKHVQAFVKNARAGFYDGSAFHRAIRLGVIQGGDPLLQHPKTPRARWGSGALSQLPDEFSDVKHLTGAVSTVRIPGKANSGGAQFFICSSAQPQLDGQFTAFGQVTEGIEVVDKISMSEAD